MTFEREALFASGGIPHLKCRCGVTLAGSTKFAEKTLIRDDKTAVRANLTTAEVVGLEREALFASGGIPHLECRCVGIVCFRKKKADKNDKTAVRADFIMAPSACMEREALLASGGIPHFERALI